MHVAVFTLKLRKSGSLSIKFKFFSSLNSVMNKINLLRKENVLIQFRKEGRRGGISSSAVGDKRNSDSEKNQIRPCDHVWFPSVLAYVPEHAVLSMRPASSCYATCVAERI